MARASATLVRQARTRFLQMPVGAAAAILGVHLLPKDPQDQEFRLLMTVVYFAAVVLLAHSLTGPRSRYMRTLFEWRFEGAGPGMEHTWRLYLRSLDRALSVTCGFIVAFVVCTALSILPRWPALTDLQAFTGLAWWGWWASLLGLVMLPVAGSNLFAEAFQRHRALDEALETSSFKPRRVAELAGAAEADRVETPPVQLVGDHRFRAGGFEWSWEDFYKNSVVFGMTGSGKTVCLLNALLDGLIGSSNAGSAPCSGLILDPKGDFRSKIAVVAKRWGRERDLVILDPGDLASSVRWNPFDSDDDELELSARFAAVAELLGAKSTGHHDAFWINSARKFVRHAIALIRLTNPPGEAPAFAHINELAVDMAAISKRADAVDDDDPRADQAISYFTRDWAALPNETRNSILPHITNMVDPFLMEPYAEVFSGRSTARMSDIIDTGKILYVHMPVADKELMARVIGTFIKLEYFREVLRRPGKARTSFFFCDEFQQFFTTIDGKGDADFFERSRQSRHANVIATQNLPGLLKAAGNNDSTVKNLLGNCAVKVFLRNTDDATNRYGSELFGQELVRMTNSSVAPSQRRWSFGGSSSQSSSSQFDQRVRPEEFVRLQVPARDEGVECAETIVHLASRGEVCQRRLLWRVHPLE